MTTAKERKSNPALLKAMRPSPELAAIVGRSPLLRTEVTKRVWGYIKKHNLQNPANKREIVADEKLERVFSARIVNMFEMAKLINKHLSG